MNDEDRQYLETLRVWAARLSLLGLGGVAGSLNHEILAGDLGSFMLVVCLILGAVTWLTRPESSAERTPRKPRLPRLPRSERREVADSIIERAKDRASRTRQAAELEAQQTLSAAEQEARLIVERARTAAAAIDPKSSHESRVRRSEPA
jgi:hypothetical protein